ncbi:glycosyl-transferase for dystroglycan-domain-containing protein [Paraphysoderma sedebokerense]|nr:glycosyl-transferase for dystroglycan-domain-containing protein [Paraphysoderma sedebokerense]
MMDFKVLKYLKLIFLLYLASSIAYFGVQLISSSDIAAFQRQQPQQQQLGNHGHISNTLPRRQSVSARAVDSFAKLTSNMPYMETQPAEGSPASENKQITPDLTLDINVKDIFGHFSNEYVLDKLFQGGLKPSQIVPYYFRAHPPPALEDIAVTTMITAERIPIFEYLVDNYKGPISVAIYIPKDPETQAKTLQELKSLYDRNPNVQKYVDAHVIIDNYPRQFNLWRNVARFFARANYIFMIDVDFFICTDIRQNLLSNAEWIEPLQSGDVAYVVPAFEYAKKWTHMTAPQFPKDKAAAVREYEDKKLIMFHNNWKRGHGPTNYAKWMEASDVYDIDAYNFNYEPYVIMRKDRAPWCDERFVGYGSNKAACLYEVFLSGIKFKVLPFDFLIHQSHEYPENDRKIERRYNNRLYSNYREESCVRYKRQLSTQEVISEDGSASASDQDMLTRFKQECEQVRRT